MSNEEQIDLGKALEEDKVEWNEAIDGIHREFGESGVREILRSLQDHVLSLNIPLDEATLNTPYVNTISVSSQPRYPGNLEIEERIEQINRWNKARVKGELTELEGLTRRRQAEADLFNEEV